MKALLIAEKPSLMRDIKTVYEKIGFPDTITFKAFRGHLLELKEPDEYDKKWEEWKLETLPIIPDVFKYKVKKDCSSLYKEIKEEIENGGYDYVINACDAGREGELIFYSFYKTVGCKLPIKRFWASDTTEETVEKALRNLIDDKDPSLIRLKASAQYRAYFDWLTGMNFSRAISLKTRATISAGRVKTPTLKMIVDRELEILNFKPKDFWELQADFGKFSATWFDKETGETRILDKVKAETLSKSLSNKGTVKEIEKKREKNYAPTLHSLLELQKEANQVYGYTADKTLKIAQVLYESKKLLTYPRTESRYLPKAMVKEIVPHIESVKDVPDVSSYVKDILDNKSTRLAVLNTTKYVDDSKVTDHHAIVPTKTKPNLSTLSTEEYNIYILVVKRFLSIFLDPNIVDKTTVTFDVDNNNFRASGKCLVQKGFMELYSASKNDKDVILPEMKKGDVLDVTKFNLLTKKTSAPKRYDDSSLLQAMQNAGRFVDDEELKNVLKESAGLGTSATRAEIISELVKKKTIERKGKLIYATNFGIQVIQTLGDRDIALPELTAKWEMKLREIEDGKYNPKAFYEEMIKYVEEVTQDIMDNVNNTINNKETIIVATCPKCGANVVEGKTFYLCSNYKQSCDFIIPKEFNGAKITKADVKKMIEGGVTGDKDFTFAKSGKKGTGKLKLNSEGAIEIVFEEKKSHEAVGKCPKCGKEIMDGNKFFVCKGYKNDCDFIVSKEYAGANITKADLLNLLNGGETEEKLCTWKSGKSGKAKLKLDENHKVMPVFNTKPASGEKAEYKSIGKCPHCEGEVLNAKDFYVCSNYPDSCNFNLKKVINKANITEQDAKDLIEGKETRSIVFSWKSGATGSAKLKYADKLEFVFENRK